MKLSANNRTQHTLSLRMQVIVLSGVSVGRERVDQFQGMKEGTELCCFVGEMQYSDPAGVSGIDNDRAPEANRPRLPLLDVRELPSRQRQSPWRLIY